MQVRTVSVTLSASRDAVFGFLADIENFPMWATEYCGRMELRHSGWWAYTLQGELLVESETDDHTGVIDFRVGPSPDELELFPIRVIALAPTGTLVSFTFVQPATQGDEQYERQFHAFAIELHRLTRHFGGGELHASGGIPQLSELGRN